MNSAVQTRSSEWRTKMAILSSSLLAEPLTTLYALVVFILYKDLHATAFQVALLTMLKPVVTVLSFYWSTGLKSRLRANVLGAGILMRLPFLLSPWFDSPWFLIAAAVNYMFFLRAGAPAWMEILKRSMPKEKRNRIFATSSVLGYVEGGLLSIGGGLLLDEYLSSWKWLFVIGALLGIAAAWVQSRVPIGEGKKEVEKLHWKEHLLRPWKDSWNLMRTKKEFAKFQWDFMLCGTAVMLIQPALILFVVDELGISYTEIATAISLAKGLGYIISSPFWTRFLERTPIRRVAHSVFLVVALFPLFLALSKWNISLFYLAYFCYGVGLGGNHLVWNLSGPHYAEKGECSIRYTGVGVVLAGLRGGFAPPLGGWLSLSFGSIPVLGIGAFLCLWSGLRKKSDKKTFALNQ